MTITSDQVNYASWRRPTDTVRVSDLFASSPTEYEMYARRQADSEAAEATIARLVLNHLGLFPDEWIRMRPFRLGSKKKRQNLARLRRRVDPNTTPRDAAAQAARLLGESLPFALPEMLLGFERAPRRRAARNSPSAFKRRVRRFKRGNKWALTNETLFCQTLRGSGPS